MSYQLVRQTENRSNYIDMANATDGLTITSERFNRTVNGNRVPHVRFNVLSVLPEGYKQAGCDDGCAPIAELQRSVRVIVNSPVASKESIIATLEWQIERLKSSDFDPVWMGFRPDPNKVFPSPTLNVGE